MLFMKKKRNKYGGSCCVYAGGDGEGCFIVCLSYIYSIFMIYLSYIYPIFILYLWYIYCMVRVA